MIDYLELGPVPAEEACQQVGTSDYNDSLALAECQRYKSMLEAKFPHSLFGIKRFDHDFGPYREVVVYISEEAPEKAFEVEAHLPVYWTDVEMRISGSI